MYILQKLGLSLFFLTTLLLNANISGLVFQDITVNGKILNSYGIKDSNEQGVVGVTVTAYPEKVSTLTLQDGSWTLNTNKDSRIEFSNWPNYLLESPDGGNTLLQKNISVQFVKNGNNNINFALYDINDYSSNSQPSYVTSLISSGSGISNNTPTLVRNDYNDTGLNSNFNDNDGTAGTGQPFQSDANASQLGTIWGKGYQVSKKRLFVASVLWRHSGFASGSPSKIWIANYNTTPVSVNTNLDLQGIAGIDLGSLTRTGNNNFILPSSINTPSIDFDAYSKIAKISYGDLDFDNKNETLWTINLNQKGLISIDASTNLNLLNTSNVKQYLLSTITGVPTCTGGELRPWGLGIHQDKGYIGFICDASVSQNKNDLKAYVSSFSLSNPTLGLTTRLSIDMGYSRKNDDGFTVDENFFPWSDNEHNTSGNWDNYNQPILSDIDFDEKGNMYLAFTDRYSLQIGYKQYTARLNSTSLTEKIRGYGEIFKVCNTNGIFELEGVGSCPEGTSRNGDVDFFDDKGGDNNPNPIGGALAIIPGSNQLLASINDPHPTNNYGRTYWSTNGIQTFNTQNGEIDNWYAHIYSGNVKYTGKGVGLGDIELLTEAPPLEIGNRIWLDNNKDGIQDANELPIVGVQVDLYQASTKLASAITDSQGHYIFSSNSNQGSNSSHKYNLTNLSPEQNYTIVIPNINGSNQQQVLTTLTSSLTLNNSGTSVNDSNAINVGNNASVFINASEIASYGTNNHSFDIGFQPKLALAIDTNTSSEGNNTNVVVETNTSSEENNTVIDSTASETNNSIVAAAVIDHTNCTCHPYESRSISSLHTLSLIILLLLTSTVSLFFIQKEIP